MHIQTLLEIINTEYQRQNYSGKFKDGGGVDSRRLGQGAYASVMNNKSDPHMVKKHHYSPQDLSADEYDGYINFAKMLINSKQMDNPSFPKIYRVKEIDDRYGKTIFRYDMEKLISYQDLEIDELMAVLNRVLDVEADRPLDRQRSIQIVLSATIENAIRNGDTSSIKDESLKSAIALVNRMTKALKNKNIKYMLDVNPGNLMYRRTKYGLQPVITDPIA